MRARHADGDRGRGLDRRPARRGPPGTRALLADPHGPPPEAATAEGTSAAILVLVGPEGGFTAEEVAAAEAAGCRRVSLGRHILRVETAAVAAAARLG